MAKKPQTINFTDTAMESFYKFSDMMKSMPVFDFSAVTAAQHKNIAALVDANRIALEGYKALFDKQIDLIDEAVAKAKVEMEGMDPKSFTDGTATASFEKAKVALEKAISDTKELAEMAQKTNMAVFEIFKTRMEESVAEAKAEAEKMAA